jgi:hypothetical protein
MTNLKHNNTNNRSQKYNFEILCYDTNNSTSFNDDVDCFYNSLLANSKLFNNEKLKKANNIITSNDQKLSIKISLTKDSPQIYNFTLSCEYQSSNDSFDSSNAELKNFSDFRKNICKYLVENIKFGKVFIARDDLSRFALAAAYGKFYTLENTLRSYIVKSFNKIYGANKSFFDSIDSEMQEKIHKRGKREDIFSSLSSEGSINTKIFLLDTDDLGNIIYKYSYGNLKLEDIIKKINSYESLAALKEDVKVNIDKHFNSFKEVNFQEKWQKIKDFRNKIAHNSLTDFDETIKIFDDISSLMSFLSEENKKVLENKDYIDIEREIYDSTPSDYRRIDKLDVLKKVKEYHQWCASKNWTFMSLKNFVYNWLAENYELSSIWFGLEELEKEGYIKIEIWKDPEGVYPDQKSIQLIKEF